MVVLFATGCQSELVETADAGETGAARVARTKPNPAIAADKLFFLLPNTNKPPNPKVSSYYIAYICG